MPHIVCLSSTLVYAHVCMQHKSSCTTIPLYKAYVLHSAKHRMTQQKVPVSKCLQQYQAV